MSDGPILWHVHYRCGCWGVHVRKPIRRQSMVCSEHGLTQAMTAFVYEPEGVDQ